MVVNDWIIDDSSYKGLRICVGYFTPLERRLDWVVSQVFFHSHSRSFLIP